jgi:hypothetical protein
MVCKGIVFISKFTNKSSIFFKTIYRIRLLHLITANNQPYKHFLKQNLLL